MRPPTSWSRELSSNCKLGALAARATAHATSKASPNQFLGFSAPRSFMRSCVPRSALRGTPWRIAVAAARTSLKMGPSGRTGEGRGQSALAVMKCFSCASARRAELAPTRFTRSSVLDVHLRTKLNPGSRFVQACPVHGAMDGPRGSRRGVKKWRHLVLRSDESWTGGTSEVQKALLLDASSPDCPPLPLNEHVPSFLPSRPPPRTWRHRRCFGRLFRPIGTWRS
jgi:hypothetical protein